MFATEPAYEAQRYADEEQQFEVSLKQPYRPYSAGQATVYPPTPPAPFTTELRECVSNWRYDSAVGLLSFVLFSGGLLLGAWFRRERHGPKIHSPPVLLSAPGTVKLSSARLGMREHFDRYSKHFAGLGTVVTTVCAVLVALLGLLGAFYSFQEKTIARSQPSQPTNPPVSAPNR